MKILTLRLRMSDEHHELLQGLSDARGHANLGETVQEAINLLQKFQEFQKGREN